MKSGARTIEDGATFDYVIVGAGSAGCVLASRLSESSSVRVLLLEAGSTDRKLDIHLPIAFTRLWFDPASNWGYETEPESQLNGRKLPIPRGKVLGGTSSINGMMAIRGQPQDYDRWRASGLQGWGYSDVLPYFRKLERHWRGESIHHGGTGPLTISAHAAPSPLMSRAQAAARLMGFPLTDDFNGPNPQGFGLPDFTIARGRRASTAAAYLRPALGRGNLAVRVGAAARRILFERGRAVGVEYVQHGVTRRVLAGREVLLCGGAINSPQLLLLSGIGPAAQLERYGIPIQVDAPDVGKNLCEHPGASFDMACPLPVAFDGELRFDRAARSMLQWFVSGKGNMASPPMVISANVATASSGLPDMHFLMVPVAMDARVWFPGIRSPRGHVLMASYSLNYPKSRGTLELRSRDPHAKPKIHFNLLSDPEDRAAMIRGYRILRELLSQPPLAEVLGEMVRPAKEPVTDAEVEAYVRAMAATAFHPAGTCRMGADQRSVVDGSLKVRGVESLRVVDASVFPDLPGGNTNLPVIMTAEKAADLIRGIAPAASVRR
jgi:choline dehydrogenase